MNTKHPAAKTSVNQVPAAFKNKTVAKILQHGYNLDYGGGKYNTATKYLGKELDCLNIVYDPLNRTREHNTKALLDPCYLSITCLNVLNVLPDKKDRIDTIKAIYVLAFEISAVRTVIFQVYEGDKSGVTKGTQANLRAHHYAEEVKEVFGLKNLYSSWEFKVIGAKKNIFILTHKES